jgi:hypothetical protein
MSFRQSGNDLTKSGSSKNLTSSIVSASPPAAVSTTSKRQVISSTGTLPYQKHVEKQNSTGVLPSSVDSNSTYILLKIVFIV